VQPFQVILVNGISATGKTAIGLQIADRLGLPFFAKDAVKERLFDTVGYSDREWAHRLSGASHAILNYVMEEGLRCGRGFVIESNFNPQFDAEKFRQWHERLRFDLVQILCFAEGAVVVERFKERVESGRRHPGHCDGDNVEPFRDYLMQGKCAPLDCGGRLIELDTTHFADVDLEALIGMIKGQSPNFA
jgi:predicted kinase